MIAQEVTLLASFMAGVFSFLSPCVLPLVPAYLSMVSGLTVEEMGSKGSQVKVVSSCLLFVAGFSAVFVIMGGTASTVGGFLIRYRRTMNLVLGGVVILMGLFVAGFLNISGLYHERRIHPGKGFLSPLGPLAAAVMGAAFGLGWTPCVGPILSSILALAATSESLYRGMLLLSVYSAGLGLPFLATGIFFSRAMIALDWVKRNQGRINRVSGSLLVFMGLLLVFDSLEILTFSL